MEYFFYGFSVFLLIYGLLSLVSIKKEKRVFHISAYIIPFWVWGIVFLFLSILFWRWRIAANILSVFVFFSLAFLYIGLTLLFTPKRKIKKKIEKWEALPVKKRRVFGVASIVAALLLFFSI